MRWTIGVDSSSVIVGGADCQISLLETTRETTFSLISGGGWIENQQYMLMMSSDLSVDKK
jgi:hypothetical protein